MLDNLRVVGHGVVHAECLREKRRERTMKERKAKAMALKELVA
jgi:hypothetical protein